MIFGGNPQRITLVGPSDSPVCLLSMCPLAKGYFNRIILMSGNSNSNNDNDSIDDIDTDNVIHNGGGASCVSGINEPYQPLEGQIEV
jgi:hypothetical protein